MSVHHIWTLIVLSVSIASVGAQPYAYVANSGSNTVAMVNVGTSAMSGSVTVASAPAGITLTPDGSTIYVSSANSGVVTAISATTHAVLGTIKVGASPTHLAAHPNGSAIYVIDQ